MHQVAKDPEMAGAAGRLVLRCEQRARESEPTQESIARLLDAYDRASPARRREIHERALYLQYGLLLHVMRDHPDVTQEMEDVQP